MRWYQHFSAYHLCAVYWTFSLSMPYAIHRMPWSVIYLWNYMFNQNSIHHGVSKTNMKNILYLKYYWTYLPSLRYICHLHAVYLSWEKSIGNIMYGTNESNEIIMFKWKYTNFPYYWAPSSPAHHIASSSTTDIIK